MTSEENKAVAHNEPLPMEQTLSSGAKRKRGRPRKYEYGMHELPYSVQHIQSVPPLHSTQDSSNIRQDGIQINHTSGGSFGPNIGTIQALPTKQGPANRSSGPRDSVNLVKTSLSQASIYTSAPLQGNSVKDDIVGKYFVGKMSKKFPGFSLITVKVKDNQVLKGWIPDENNLRPITPKDDLAPDLPMLRPSQVRKRPSTVYRQASGPIPVPLEDVTFAKPLQMRRPVEKSFTKHTVPSVPRPHMGSGVVAAVPISVSPSNAESRIFSEQGTEHVNPQPLSAVVPIKSGQPVLASCKEVAGGKTVNEIQTVSESSKHTEESSDHIFCVIIGERHLLNVPVMDAIKESLGPKEQPNATNSKQQTFMEPPEQAVQLDTERDISKGADDSKSEASGGTAPPVEASTAVHNPQDDSHEMKVDNK
ncbi:uncharacterized protein [Oryza sativa Japonica Group]|uniref:uncharacterized protein isoform X2 n=1 Tax=Oryza sativa subsp. japonica TaxID=39947 RepID=UPI00077550F5|nr:uncharacterized protein LOC4337066 isoform X2 [Oryza sativa Japonica Group]